MTQSKEKSENSARLAPKGNGGRHCCQPPLRRAKDMPVFVTWLIEAFALPTRSRSWLTSSGVASHLATLSFEKPGRSTVLRHPKVRWSFDLPGLIETGASTKATRCSAALLGEPSTASRFAHQSSEEPREPRRATGRSLFRRLIPADPNQNPKVLFIACRRRSDLWSPAALFRVVADPSEEAGTAVPITWSPCTSDSSRGSEKCGSRPVDNVDIGEQHWEPFRVGPFGCRFVPSTLPRASA